MVALVVSAVAEPGELVLHQVVLTVASSQQPSYLLFRGTAEGGQEPIYSESYE